MNNASLTIIDLLTIALFTALALGVLVAGVVAARWNRFNKAITVSQHTAANISDTAGSAPTVTKAEGSEAIQDRPRHNPLSSVSIPRLDMLVRSGGPFAHCDAPVDNSYLMVPHPDFLGVTWINAIPIMSGGAYQHSRRIRVFEVRAIDVTFDPDGQHYAELQDTILTFDRSDRPLDMDQFFVGETPAFIEEAARRLFEADSNSDSDDGDDRPFLPAA